MYQPFQFQGPPKFSQTGIFGLYHLATVVSTHAPPARDFKSCFELGQEHVDRLGCLLIGPVS
jgi:hypothetical protein